MSEHRCPGCGETFRRGKRAHVIMPEGEIARRLVCAKCADSRAMVLVLPSAGVALCSSCETQPARPASICGDCLNDAVHRAVRTALAPFAKHLRGMATAYKATKNPLCLGLAMAADVLDAARAVPLEAPARNGASPHVANKPAVEWIPSPALLEDVGEHAKPRRRPSARPPAADEDLEPDTDMPRGEHRVLVAVAQHVAGVTRRQLTILTGYKRSTRDLYVQKLRQRGSLEQIEGRLLATDGGVAALGPSFHPLPQSGPELVEHARETLPGGELTVFDAVLRAGAAGVTRAQLSEETGYTRSTRDLYVQRLIARELCESRDGRVRAAPEVLAS